MTFLNATLIFGALAVAIPIALHLLARREPRKVTFPAVQFLKKRFESNRSRLQIRRWWLLALRMAAIAAVAFALARPAIDRSLSLTWITIGLLALVGIGLLVMASVALASVGLASVGLGQDRQKPDRLKPRGANPLASQATGYALAAASLLILIIASLWGVSTAMSGPAMSIDQAQPVALAIVLDNSPSSDWKSTNDDRIARMKDLATWMVTRLPRTSRIAIVDRSAQVVSFSLDAGNAISRIDQLKPLEVVQPIASRIEAGANLVRTSEISQRRVLVISDLTAETWDDAVSDSTLSTSFQTDPAVALTLFDLGEFAALNRSLAIPRFDDTAPAKGVPIKVSSTLSVSGDAGSATSATVELELFQNDPALPVVRDGQVVLPNIRSVDRTSVRVDAGANREFLLSIAQLELGTHHGRIRLVGDDAISFDDVRYFSLQVQPPSRILVIGDNEEESRIIGDAISVSSNLPAESAAAFDVERIGYQDLPRVRLEDFDALVLLDPARDALADQTLLDYLGTGGGLFVCLGPAAGDDALESSLVPSLVRRWRSPDPGSFLEVVNVSHAVTEPLSENTPWGDFRVQQYWQVKPLETDRVLMRFAGTEHAALIQRTITRSASQSTGRVLLLTTPIPALAQSTRPWNDLFGTDGWPAWLMTRKSVQYLSGRGTTDHMSAVGQPRLIPLQTSFLSDQPSDPLSPNRLQLFRPGSVLPVPLTVPAGTQQLAIDDVSRSGTYWIRGLQAGDGFSANLPEQSLNLDRIERGQLDLVFGADQYTLATSREEIKFAESTAAQRVSLHSPAMLLALAIFLLEQVLANRFYRKPAKSPALAT